MKKQIWMVAFASFTVAACDDPTPKSRQQIHNEMIGCFCEMTPLNDSGSVLRMSTCVDSAQRKIESNCSDCNNEHYNLLEKNKMDVIFKFVEIYERDPLKTIFQCREKFPKN